MHVVKTEQRFLPVIDRFRIALRRRGLDVRRWRPPEGRRAALIRSQGIQLVLDVGANRGQYGESLRASGYMGRIISFEPLHAAYAALEARTTADPLWECRRIGLADVDGAAEIHVAGNSASSSLLPMREEHVRALPHSAYVGKETIALSRLDTAVSKLPEDANTMLKLDVQGYELHVLEGARHSLAKITVVETELSLVRLYDGQPLLKDMTDYLYEAGFELLALEPGFHDSASGRILQFDGMFVRRHDGSFDRF
jgi:FkbM family methyltransferase